MIQLFTFYPGLIPGLRPANETALLHNDVFHWLGASLESALFIVFKNGKYFLHLIQFLNTDPPQVV